MFREPIVPKTGCWPEVLLFVLIIVLLSVSLPGCAALGDWIAGECSFRCERQK